MQILVQRIANRFLLLITPLSLSGFKPRPKEGGHTLFSHDVRPRANTEKKS